MTKRKIKKLFEDDLSKTFTPTITAKDIIEKTDYFKYKKVLYNINCIVLYVY